MHDARLATKLRRERAHLPPLTNAIRAVAPIERVTRIVDVYGPTHHTIVRRCALSLPRVRFLERAAEGEV
jgi:hypothetical protein